MPFKPTERQYRNFVLEVDIPDTQEKKIDTEYYVEGYALKYAPYLFYETEEGPVYEEFKREAFENTDMSDVIFLCDHEGKVFARNRNGSLLMWFDDVGLRIAADLGLTAESRAMYEGIQAGLYDRMSWSFKYGDVRYDEGTRTITHFSVPKIYDVSAVSFPANSDTEIYARKFADGLIEQVEQEFAKREKQKKKLKTILMLEEILHEQK